MLYHEQFFSRLIEAEEATKWSLDDSQSIEKRATTANEIATYNVEMDSTFIERDIPKAQHEGAVVAYH